MSLTGGVLTAPPRAGGAVHALLRTTDGALLTLARSDDEPPLTIPRDPAREAARRELSGRLYHEHDPSLLQRALNTLWDWISNLLDTAAGATPGRMLGVLVVLAAVMAVVGALWWRLGLPRRQPAPAAPLFDDRPRTAAEHRAAAETHAAQGHWNQALQDRMRAVVRSLEERALLDTRPGRTADEAAAEAGRTLPAHSDRLRAAACDFDDVTYGGRPASEQAYHRIAALDLDLERTKPQLTASSTPSTAPTSRQGAAE